MSNTCGGILIAGRCTNVSFSDVLLGCFSVTVAVQDALAPEGEKWWLTSVYGPCEDGDKAIFLEELEAIRDLCAGPWAVTGDFNLILNETDKSNDRIDRANMRRFRRTVHELGLQDMHFHGRLFTWSNKRLVPTMVRLDRVLISPEWDEQFPNAHLRGLGSDATDHCPLLLQSNVGQMVSSWQRPAAISDPFLRLDSMMRNLVRDLQRWAASNIRDIKAQLLMTRELVRRLDLMQERRQLNDAETATRKRLKLKCLGHSSMERTMARQCSRVRQIEEGDANTAYFHLMARGR